MHAASIGLGGRPHLDSEIAALGDPLLTPARVLAQHRGRWLVAGADGEPRLVPARARVVAAAEGPPVTGDWVALDAGGAVTTVLERRGVLARRAAGPAVERQLLAANVDLALLVEPLPAPNPRRGVPAALVLTKADLVDDGHLVAARLARELGLFESAAVSARDDTDLGALRGLLIPDATAVLLGPSGAGKSTLVNALLGADRQPTGPVREGDGRGRHTTVTREMVALPSGALLVDTPGIREVGLWDGAGEAFADVDGAARRCRFRDCRHQEEPGCAVVRDVDPARLEAWRKLEREQAWVDDKRAASRARGEQLRQRTRQQRADRRSKGSG